MAPCEIWFGRVALAGMNYIRTWQLLARTWDALAQAHSTYFNVLHCRAAHPDQALAAMADALSPQLRKTFTVEALRQTLHRARALFADLLLAEVAQSLSNPGQDAVMDELAELNLLTYCQPALDRQEKPH